MPVPFQCPLCGHLTQVNEQYLGQSGPCAGCGRIITVTAAAAPSYAPKPIGEDPMIRMLLPVGRSLWAIAAGYAGLFAILFIPAPVALILGIVAIWDIKTHPDRHGMGRAIFGLVMGILFTIGLVIAIGAAAVMG
jgi:hypothetical protein